MPGPGTVTNSNTNLNRHHIPSLVAHIRGGGSLTNTHMHKIAGDGSSRQFFRFCRDGKSQVLMLLPEDEQTLLQKQTHPWVQVCDSLRQAHIRTPHIYQKIPESCCLIVEDCSDTTLLRHLHQNISQSKMILNQATSLCAQINRAPITTAHSDFTSEFFVNELLFFHHHSNSSTPTEDFRKDAASLCDEMTKASLVFTHRDFHTRNIMINTNKEWVLIDFQDARMGPAAYDLVSLCFDPYMKINFQSRLHLLQDSLPKFQHSEDIRNTWRYAAIQRLIKAMGSFFYLTNLNRGDYKQYIPIAYDILHNIGLDDWPALKHAVENARHA